MKILVTGGAGFIGSHIVDAYLEAGHQVAVVDNLSTGSRKNVHGRAEFYALDILDPAFADVVAQFAPDVLSHHAAQTDLRRSVTEPAFDATSNILGLVQVLEACRQGRIKKVIFASSGGAVYGEPATWPSSEEHPTNPMTPYGVSKLTGEHYLFCYHKLFDLHYIALRYGNVYGPRQLATGEAGVMAIFTQRLLEGKRAIINGDGKQTRDYVYVGDIVRANLLALDASFTGVLNIGTGVETSVEALFASLRDRLDSGARATYGPVRLGDQSRSCLDASRARALLGWSPQTTLSAGLDETVHYYRQRISQ